MPNKAHSQIYYRDIPGCINAMFAWKHLDVLNYDDIDVGGRATQYAKAENNALGHGWS